ncbi:hypothetical protein NPIL_276101 [Nephila pilipes]|uniref:Uncharacterized protein n=1 Tax=Nephila pilipes TaxID=299642 RepID=A0A8X6UP90_NEPPI|nr:hypothetical protein NPIL_276101 [Nephila pilipes]
MKRVPQQDGTRENTANPKLQRSSADRSGHKTKEPLSFTAQKKKIASRRLQRARERRGSKETGETIHNPARRSSGHIKRKKNTLDHKKQ